MGGREYRDLRSNKEGESGRERGNELLVLALKERGVVSEKSELRGDMVVCDEVDGERGGVGNVFAKSDVSMRALASKLMSRTICEAVFVTLRCWCSFWECGTVR